MYGYTCTYILMYMVALGKGFNLDKVAPVAKDIEILFRLHVYVYIRLQILVHMYAYVCIGMFLTLELFF